MMIHPQCWPRAPTSKIRPCSDCEINWAAIDVCAQRCEKSTKLSSLVVPYL